jgi:iron complex transport system permease protein
MQMHSRVRKFLCDPENVDTCMRMTQQHQETNGAPPTWQINLAQHGGEISVVTGVTGSGAAEAAAEEDSTEVFAAEAAAWGGWPSALIAAALGAGAVLGLLLLVSRRIQGPVTLLVFGLMLGYVVSAVMSVLQAQADPNALQRFVLWGMGTFAAAPLPVSLVLGSLALGLAIWVRLRHRSLDAWTLGPTVAESMGVETGRLGWELLAITGLVTGAVTAACGPVAFLGLATPHVARMFWKDRSHRAMNGPVAGLGMVLALLADGLVRWPGGMEEALPLNAVLAMGGAPFVVWLTWKKTWEA